MLTHLELRKLFKDFWEENGHKEVPPIPLVPQNDPTTLFTGSGMQQLVPNLLGEPHPLGKRLYNIQRSFRSQDIEEIGDNRHTTMFEMMGNWSLGDYFKEEQLSWFYEFLTTKLKLNVEKLHVTVFEGTKNVPKDEESANIWKKLGIPENRIHYYIDKNWWSRAGSYEQMPVGELGGPDSEVFYDFGTPHDPAFGKECHVNCDCGRFSEIGNSVFVQYKKTENGLEELSNRNVDFGGGIERQLAAANNNPDIFLTDTYTSALLSLEKFTSKKYSDEKNQRAIRIILDHMKAAALLILDGVRPSNKERGYVLRRLLRRSAIKYRSLVTQFKPTDLTQIARASLLTYEGVYFNISKDESKITEMTTLIDDEMKKFGKTLEQGLREAGKINEIDGTKAFDLYQTFGFPLEVTEELFIEKGQKIDRTQFKKEFDKHKDLSRSASAGKFKGGLADHSDQVLKYHTATHLLHQALFDVFGNDIRQEGSNITAERLRFDFYSTKKPTDEDVKKVESIINAKVSDELPMRFKIMPKEDAIKIGARSFFRDKYPDSVKVYYIGGNDDQPETAYSKEFCGGPHVTNTKEIGKIQIYKVETIGSNLFRIYAK